MSPIVILKYFIGATRNLKQTMKLGSPSCLNQIFLQTHNLQRIIFRIFGHQSNKFIFKQSKKVKLGSTVSYNYPHLLQTGKKNFWITSLPPFSSQGVFEGPI